MDNTVRWVSNLQELNRVVLHKQYPLPIISDIPRKQTGYTFFSQLDISIQYYTFALDEESKDLTRIVKPFGKYCYNVLPMGLKRSPGFAQKKTWKTYSAICGLIEHTSLCHWRHKQEHLRKVKHSKNKFGRKKCNLHSTRWKRLWPWMSSALIQTTINHSTFTLMRLTYSSVCALCKNVNMFHIIS